MLCPFEEICSYESSACNRCKDRGILYLINRVFLPKTLIPKNYQSASFLDLDLKGEANNAVRYLDKVFELVNEGKGMYCYGIGPGTGKTTICCIALMRYLYLSLKKDPYDIDNRRVLYLNTTEFLERLRKSMNSQDLELETLIEELTDIDRAPKLILLDDIGAEKSSEWVQERFYSLINFRVANGLATLFTSNYSMEELEPRLGYRIYSRIAGCCKPIQFVGKDHRRCEW